MLQSLWSWWDRRWWRREAAAAYEKARTSLQAADIDPEAPAVKGPLGLKGPVGTRGPGPGSPS